LRELRELPAGASYRTWHERIRRHLPSQQYTQSPNLLGAASMLDWPALPRAPHQPAASAPASKRPSSPLDSGIADAFDAGRSLALQTLAQRPQRRALHRAPRVPLLAEGDSWFDYPFHDVLSCLEDEHGFEVTAVAHRGDTVESMAYSDGQLNDLVRTLDKMLRRGERPRAILLSGGGNDVAGDEFAQLLNHSRSPRRGLQADIVKGVVDERIRDSFVAMVAALTAICEERLQQRIPIVMHGYAYAVPDGRGFLGGFWFLPGPWLRPGFEQKGYTDARENQTIVDTLIDRLNAMQQQLAGSPGLEHLHHVDLRPVLPRDDYREWWANELHPTKAGFRRVAQAIATRIAGL
jgi:lysophospholipase L1-like esterase